MDLLRSVQKWMATWGDKNGQEKTDKKSEETCLKNEEETSLKSTEETALRNAEESSLKNAKESSLKNAKETSLKNAEVITEKGAEGLREEMKKQEGAQEKEGNKKGKKNRVKRARENTEEKHPVKKSKQKKGGGKLKLKLKYLDNPLDSERQWPERLLIVDLNGFLVHRSKKRLEGYNMFKDPNGNFFLDRPHCREFIGWAMTRGFRLAIWTSARSNVAHEITKRLLLPKFQPERDLEFVFHQEQCIRGFSKTSTVPTYRKCLNKVWEDKRFSARFNPSNTLIIDNSPEKTEYAPNNRITVGSFDPEHSASNIYTDDLELGQNGKLWAFLDQLSRYDGDVPSFIISNPYVAP